MNRTVLVWFRADLRLEDNLALRAAGARGERVVPVYIWAPEEEGKWSPGAASRWWLHRSLQALAESLRERGSRLVVRRGPTLEALEALVRETGAGAVYWNRRYEPAVVERDTRVRKGLQEEGIETGTFNSALLYEPWTIQTQTGGPFQVFTPFWKRCLGTSRPEPAAEAPQELPGPESWPESVPLEALGLEPRWNWAGGMAKEWRPGEAGAKQQLESFIARGLSGYDVDRERPDLKGTSRLSAHLHFGEIGPRQIWAALEQRREQEADAGSAGAAALARYGAELGWREFGYHLLYHFPQTAERPLKREFERFPWHTTREWLQAWQQGRTGYPLVDAGMRELWATGWMHNRVRMVVASFLVKQLQISWTEGAKWFWETLVDADLASNTLGWQWSAGCGADAAPYFRVFNPVAQGEKFDAQGDYVRHWVPELAGLATKYLHQPWKAPEAVWRAGAGRSSYPKPLVNHYIARNVALEAYGRMRAK